MPIMLLLTLTLSKFLVALQINMNSVASKVH
uniref:Uncharacterized protein n=1 Tax=Arundo donax TaxID=35708 RepID=A0A0A9EAQ2_ARUDO